MTLDFHRIATTACRIDGAIALAFCGCAVELEQIPREVVAAIVFPDATDRIEMGRDWLGKRTVAGCISADGELRAALGVFCERCQCPTQVYA